MPKMKHLLRKLHIGGEVRPVNNSAQSPVSSSGAPTSVSSLSSSSSSAATMGRMGAENAVSERTVGMAEESTLDYNLLEEEYQVQLALAMSASDSEQVKREDPESEQIKAAKRMSLGCSPSVAESESFAEFLSLRYWNYNFVNYDEKVMDGFYDVYGITPSSIIQGKMPSLLDLQVISIADSDDYEVILVNRSVDSELQLLEDRAYLISMESQSTETGLGFGGLIQKVACLVVDRLGGPVGDADEMVKRWSVRKSELRSSLNTIIFPLGSLDVGLSRHRALLFKVLADKINLPCMLVKGSYYTGTDEGAVNLIKVDNGSEYIIDLMGAPGTLIPSEVPGNFLPNFDFDRKCFTGAAEFSKDSSIVLGKETLFMDMPHALDRVVKAGGSVSEEASSLCFPKAQTGKASTEKADVWGSESRFGNFLPYIPKSREDSLGIEGIASSAEKKNVKNVSRYVISAAKDPEFAQKLHAVLLESGASPPADLFSGMNFQEKKEQEVHKEKYLVQDMSISSFYQPGKFLLSNDQPVMPSTFAGQQLVELSAHKHNKSGIGIMDSELSLLSATTSDGYVLLDSGANEAEQNDTVCDSTLPANLSSMAGGASNGEQALELPLLSVPSICQRNAIALVNEGKLCSNDNIGRIVNNIQKDKKLEARLMETAVPGAPFSFNVHTEKNNPVLSEVAEWEIQWKDLHIGERIGIGSYGEVYRADWNGTEVAVKKFLDQDFSGDALAQFKCEIEIMLRLRHPNIVLFMGAVTRPPTLSILTEYLPRGSLYRLLHRSSLQLDEKRRIRMAIDVAKGMNYLHASHPTIVHRDLKSPNLLVDKNWVVKVCDFGLSRLKHHTFLSSRSTAGTPEWMAPEVLRNEPANEKCDVYSFGVILWELVTLCVPWTGLNPMQVVGAVGFQNRRLKIEQNIDPAVAKIMNDCWQIEPDLRPTFAQLIARLKQVQCLCVPRSVCATQTRE